MIHMFDIVGEPRPGCLGYHEDIVWGWLEIEVLDTILDVWPNATGASVSGFRVVRTGPRTISVYNRMSYAKHVEFAGRSPHQGCARAAILERWPSMVDAATDFAAALDPSPKYTPPADPHIEADYVPQEVQ